MGLGVFKKVFSLQPSVCRYPPNPGFIGCLCPAMLFGLSRGGKGGGEREVGRERGGGREEGGRTHVLLCGNTLIRP